MKNNYEVRATKFATFLCNLFRDCSTLDDFITTIQRYNLTHYRPIHYQHGVSRIAILRADYVIKFNYRSDDRWCDPDGRCFAGDNESEQEIYMRAVKSGYAHLLAKTTTIHLDGRTISIMPRIDHVGEEGRDWRDFVTKNEYRWLMYNVNDLHAYNVGYYKDKPVVIDYGWDAKW